MKVELSRFKIKHGKSSRVDEWMRLLNERMEEVLATLEDEKMYVETIFRDGDHLYWYTVQGEGARHVSQSNHEIDKLHVEFSKECIDLTTPPENLFPEVVMIAPDIMRLIKE